MIPITPAQPTIHYWLKSAGRIACRHRKDLLNSAHRINVTCRNCIRTNERNSDDYTAWTKKVKR